MCRFRCYLGGVIWRCCTTVQHSTVCLVGIRKANVTLRPSVTNVVKIRILAKKILLFFSRNNRLSTKTKTFSHWTRCSYPITVFASFAVASSRKVSNADSSGIVRGYLLWSSFTFFSCCSDIMAELSGTFPRRREESSHRIRVTPRVRVFVIFVCCILLQSYLSLPTMPSLFSSKMEELMMYQNITISDQGKTLQSASNAPRNKRKKFLVLHIG